MAAIQEPKISIKISLSSYLYHFSNPTPPEISVVVESFCDRPITLFTWGTPLDPASARTQGGFVIIDLANDESVPQTSSSINRTPFSRARGSGDEKYFMTLHPNTPIISSTRFGRAAGYRPQPKAIVERGWEVDEQGNEKKTRRSVRGCGVDGLEAGHRYRVDVARGKLLGTWWRWGTKDDIMIDEGATDWNLSELEQEQVPLDFEQIDGVEFAIEE
ncbi:MAG: hypothetical protein M1827_006794 [Pycnora praestabilis]|nr:MAG: hypothetical protein M1827_006794 [Pycnora praestabilis]